MLKRLLFLMAALFLASSPALAIQNPQNETHIMNMGPSFGQNINASVLIEKSAGNYFAALSSKEFWYYNAVSGGWAKRSDLNVTPYSLAVDPSGGIYVSGANRSSGEVYKSADNGTSWRRVNSYFINYGNLKARYLGGKLLSWKTAGRTEITYIEGGDPQQPWMSKQTNVFVRDIIQKGGDIYFVGEGIGADAGKVRFYKFNPNPPSDVADHALLATLPESESVNWGGSNTENPRILSAYGGYFYLITRKVSGIGGSVFRSLDGTAWESVFEVQNDLPMSINSAHNDANGLLIVTKYGKIFKTWNGTKWEGFNTYADWGYDILPTSEQHKSFYSLSYGPSDTIVTDSSNAWPVVNARYSFFYGATSMLLTLDARSTLNYTFDWENDTINYINITQLSGPSIMEGSVISSESADARISRNIEASGNYVFLVSVRDNKMSSAASAQVLNVLFNKPPVGVLEKEKVCIISQVCSVTGSGSDPEGDPFTYSWEYDGAFEIVGGEAMIVRRNFEWVSNSTNTLSFIPKELGNYTFYMALNDSKSLIKGGASITITSAAEGALPANQSLNATNNTTANNATEPSPAGSQAQPINLPPDVVVKDAAGNVGEVVMLSAYGKDPEGKQVTYSWRQVGGKFIQLAGAGLQNPSFVGSVPGTYTFEVIATDSDGYESMPAMVRVTITEPEGAKGGGAAEAQKLDMNTISILAAMVAAAVVFLSAIFIVVWKVRTKVKSNNRDKLAANDKKKGNYPKKRDGQFSKNFK